MCQRGRVRPPITRPHKLLAGRKCITTVQGLNEQLDLKKIIKAIKKTHCCNGTIVDDEGMGQVLQFQGDQRDNVLKFLLENGECHPFQR